MGKMAEGMAYPRLQATTDQEFIHGVEISPANQNVPPLPQ